MSLREREEDINNWVCPDLRSYWQLGKQRETDKFILKNKAGDQAYAFSEVEGYALRYFTGQLTIQQVQAYCDRQFDRQIPSDLTVQLVKKLIGLGLLTTENDRTENRAVAKSAYQLKSTVQWIERQGYWILRNSEDVSFLQVSLRDRQVIDQLEVMPISAIVDTGTISQAEVRSLLQLLAATGMLVGTQPAKPRQRKFTPLQLLYFKFPLFNPDRWLTQTIHLFRWIWTTTFGILLTVFLIGSAVVGYAQRSEIFYSGQQLWKTQGTGLIIPFALITALVVSLHELGHAYTLKNYGGIVPEVGVFFMFFIPAAYTNTTDSYCLSRGKRVLVVAAGVLVQVTLAAIALWLWKWTAEGVWLHAASYLLMIAALFTIALNLNPLSKFDGYYLFSALTGINNLRSRSFGFYANLFRGQVRENSSDCWMLAAYAPLSFVYLQLVFGFILYQAIDWIMTHAPMTAALLFVIWLIYFVAPTCRSTARS